MGYDAAWHIGRGVRSRRGFGSEGVLRISVCLCPNIPLCSNCALVDITGNDKVVMQYERYEYDIVQRYNVELVGWTADKFVNPSDRCTGSRSEEGA